MSGTLFNSGAALRAIALWEDFFLVDFFFLGASVGAVFVGASTVEAAGSELGAVGATIGAGSAGGGAWRTGAVLLASCARRLVVSAAKMIHRFFFINLAK